MKINTLIFSFLFLVVGNCIAQGGDIAFRTEEESRTIDVFKRTNEAVVFITTTTLSVDPFEFFPEVESRQGIGSGVLLSGGKGLIITNLHVIKDAQKIELLIGDGRSLKAKYIGADPDTDIALLQAVNLPENFKGVELADSSKLEVGQKVIAIGNPFGLNRTLTQGIISSVDRAVKNPNGRTMRGLIQTDAAINPGNSGGPLLDMNGRLIGINTQILSNSGDSAGIGFAVPVNQIMRVIPELITSGKVRKPKLGWMLANTDEGVMVRRIFAGGPAELAGIEPIERPVGDTFVRGVVRDFNRADLIYAVNGVRVTTSDDVDEIVQKSAPDKPISFVLRRGGRSGPERKISITPVLQ